MNNDQWLFIILIPFLIIVASTIYYLGSKKSEVTQGHMASKMVRRAIRHTPKKEDYALYFYYNKNHSTYRVI